MFVVFRKRSAAGQCLFVCIGLLWLAGFDVDLNPDLFTVYKNYALSKPLRFDLYCSVQRSDFKRPFNFSMGDSLEPIYIQEGILLYERV